MTDIKSPISTMISDLRYIRDYYQVDAYIGTRVLYGGSGKLQRGRITGTHGAALKIIMDGETVEKTYHPTWQIKYLSDDAETVKE